MAASSPAVPGYRVLRPIGQGGMGAVFAVEPDDLPGATRALKILPGQDAGRRARFLREAELLARVEGHPALARVHAAGEHEGQLWLVMELVDGEDLARVVARRGRLPWGEAAELLAGVADGLARVHALGVLHRDIKPANIIAARGEHGVQRAVLVDFGVATAVDLERLTRTGVVVGTPAYLSPEACRGGELDARTDVYALGATLFELLTGRLLFEGGSAGELFRAVLHDAPCAPSALAPTVPPAIDDLVLRALAKDRRERPADGGAFAAELRRALADPRATGRSRPGAALLALAVAAFALGAAAVAWRGLRGEAAAAPWSAGPAAAVSTVRPAAPAPAIRNPLLDALDLGAADALRAVRLARDQRLKAPLVDGAVEAALRAEALAQARSRPLDVAALVAWLEAVGIVRDAFAKAGRPPPPDAGALADAALEAAEALLADVGGDDRRASNAAGEGIARIFEALVASRLRPGGRGAAEAFMVTLADSFLRGSMTGTLEANGPFGAAYDRILIATVDLDIDVDGARLREPSGSGYQAEVLRVRDLLAGPKGGNPAYARRSIELAKEHADRLGPVSRARLLAVVPAGELDDHALRRLGQAKALDPGSAHVRLVLAQTLRAAGRLDEAAAEARAALALHPESTRTGAPLSVGGLSDLRRSCVRIFLDVGALDDAERLLDRVEARSPSSVEQRLREELEALKAKARPSGARAPRGL